MCIAPVYPSLTRSNIASQVDSRLSPPPPPPGIVTQWLYIVKTIQGSLSLVRDNFLGDVVPLFTL